MVEYELELEPVGLARTVPLTKSTTKTTTLMTFEHHVNEEIEFCVSAFKNSSVHDMMGVVRCERIGANLARRRG